MSINVLFNGIIESLINFFIMYHTIGRLILNFLHMVFDNIFNLLLFITFIASALYYVMSIYILFKKKKQENFHQDTKELPSVTVQIPTFNELAAIRCAKNCLNFDYPKDKYEIIIGDDSNNPEISEKLQEFAEKHDLVRITKRESNEGYKPGNLNNMLKHSRGELLVIFDSDFVPQSDFLLKIVKPFMKDKKVAGVQARWRVMNPNQNFISLLGATIVSVCHYITLPFIHQSRKISFLCGSAEAVRKNVLIKLGGWESGNLTEDIEFSLRVLKEGYKIEYLQDLECDSEVPYTLKDLCRQQMRWAYGVIYSWKKHFKSVMRSNNIGALDKFNMGGLFCSGYFLSILLAGLFITGTLSFITNEPAPLQWGKFFYELTRNILLTSGLIFASIIALVKTNRIKSLLSIIASSFSYGLIVTCYVNIGIFKALVKVPMRWYMLKKHGNEVYD